MVILILEDMVKSCLSGATHAKIQTIYADNLAFRAEFEEGLLILKVEQ